MRRQRVADQVDRMRGVERSSDRGEDRDRPLGGQPVLGGEQVVEGPSRREAGDDPGPVRRAPGVDHLGQPRVAQASTKRNRVGEGAQPSRAPSEVDEDAQQDVLIPSRVPGLVGGEHPGLAVQRPLDLERRNGQPG